jgi:hypothetical protein
VPVAARYKRSLLSRPVIVPAKFTVLMPLSNATISNRETPPFGTGACNVIGPERVKLPPLTLNRMAPAVGTVGSALYPPFVIVTGCANVPLARILNCEFEGPMVSEVLGGRALLEAMLNVPAVIVGA